MINAQKYTYTVGAGLTQRVPVVGSHFRLLAATGPVDVSTDKVRFEQCGAGDGFEKVPFSFLVLKDASGSANTVTFVVADEAFLTSPTSQVIVSANAPAQDGSITNTARTVTNASAQLLAANTARRYLMVQNKSTTGTIFLNFGAGAATTANGIRLGPGAVWEWDFNVPTKAIQAIGDIASNPDVLTVEG